VSGFIGILLSVACFQKSLPAGVPSSAALFFKAAVFALELKATPSGLAQDQEPPR
jgi:hypothetical protein